MNLNDYINLKYPFEMIPDELEGGYTIVYPDLIGCISCGNTIEDAIKNGEEARIAWIKSEIENNNDIPLPGDLSSYSGQFKLRIPKTLHRSLALNAKKEGISMNQYCLYLLSKNDALNA